MRRSARAFAALLALAGCSKAAENSANDAAPAPAAASPDANVALPDDGTPIAEPDGPIDPKSAEAAGQVVQSYGALIEQRRFPEAEKLWSSEGSARAFSDAIAYNDETHLEIGAPGEMEGAAGSTYVTVPVVFYGKRDGADFRRGANVILRRVNDVPGSTDEQRRWHIERIDWKD